MIAESCIVAFLVDRLSKKVVKKKIPIDKPRRLICKGHMFLDHAKNKGLMLNTLDNKPGMVKWMNVITACAIGLILYPVLKSRKLSYLHELGLGLLIGGGLGNVVDRIIHNEVTDFIGFTRLRKIIFNFADFFIFIGGFLTLLAEFISLFKKS